MLASAAAAGLISSRSASKGRECSRRSPAPMSAPHRRQCRRPSLCQCRSPRPIQLLPAWRNPPRRALASLRSPSRASPSPSSFSPGAARCSSCGAGRKTLGPLDTAGWRFAARKRRRSDVAAAGKRREPHHAAAAHPGQPDRPHEPAGDRQPQRAGADGDLVGLPVPGLRRIRPRKLGPRHQIGPRQDTNIWAYDRAVIPTRSHPADPAGGASA
jgi:hypothetical protein